MSRFRKAKPNCYACKVAVATRTLFAKYESDSPKFHGKSYKLAVVCTPCANKALTMHSDWHTVSL